MSGWEDQRDNQETYHACLIFGEALRRLFGLFLCDTSNTHISFHHDTKIVGREE
jgi:hypothetical protein